MPSLSDPQTGGSHLKSRLEEPNYSTETGTGGGRVCAAPPSPPLVISTAMLLLHSFQADLEN